MCGRPVHGHAKQKTTSERLVLATVSAHVAFTFRRERRQAKQEPVTLGPQSSSVSRSPAVSADRASPRTRFQIARTLARLSHGLERARILVYRNRASPVHLQHFLPSFFSDRKVLLVTSSYFQYVPIFFIIFVALDGIVIFVSPLFLF